MEQYNSGFKYISEQFADIMVLRYRVPGFEELPLRQKELAYYLYQAALCGREIIFDQHYKYNLKIKRTLEAIVKSYRGERNNVLFEKFMVYMKRIWFSNGIHHHYSSKKILPEFTEEYFRALLKGIDPALLPLTGGQTADGFINDLIPKIFDPAVATQKVNLEPGTDVITSSSNNFYEGVTQREAEDFYSGI